MEDGLEIGIRKWLVISKYQILEKQGGLEKNNLWPETFEDFKKNLILTLDNKKINRILFYEFFTSDERREIDRILEGYR